MAMPSSGIIPAQLGFLAIYNPSLGATDETVDDQVVYYASIDAGTGRQRRRHRSKPGKLGDNASQEERNEYLRQIGLAQGMVEFSRSFSGGKPVDTIETEKSRVVLHELEPGWWILASIDLTRLPLPARKQPSSTKSTGPGAKVNAPDSAEAPDEGVEYSSREVKPSALLLQDLLRAHSIFLLHHDSSLSALFVRSKRAKFSSILSRYWDLFLSSWNVLLHGNPIRNVFGGVKIAACGELGVGVGEEDRGSGEREVLEGLVGRIEGLVDLVVGKFGDVDPADGEPTTQQNRGSVDDGTWLGTGNEAGAEDGAVFLGVGALSKHSLRDITYWMEDIYSWGENAYGVLDSPTATRARNRGARAASTKAVTTQPFPSDPHLPPPLKGLPGVGSRGNALPSEPAGGSPMARTAPEGGEHEAGGMDKFINYLKLGYGTAWTLGGAPASDNPDPTGSASLGHGYAFKPKPSGRYLIGLVGDIEEAEDNSNLDEPSAGYTEDPEANSRTSLRTLTVELEAENGGLPESEVTRDLGSHDQEVTELWLSADGHDVHPPATTFDSQDRNKTKKLRVVVYVNRPFIFTFLFQLRTDSLAWDGLYRSLHYQLAPLRKPLLNSTAYRPARPDIGSVAAQIYDLVWDPRAMTIHSTIPNIPEPGLFVTAFEGQAPWTRLEALNTHIQLLNTYTTARADPSELERTCKTSRGWWIVWSRIMEREPPRPSALSKSTSEEGSDSRSSKSVDGDEEEEVTPTQDFALVKEIVLIRKASDRAGSGVRGLPREPGVVHSAQSEIKVFGMARNQGRRDAKAFACRSAWNVLG
ncbi:hypothetical protein GQ53DRAFT_756693 [Thozetella sp. PMI_491]|nr:hypothetical protein GQ53DRAFT_756693 [Thozetella sp. PMI_491]